uniref:PE-PPE domain-containing protein n=1 Tax=Mycobacterium sp. TaxID=1785 RepID=UPI0031E37572
LLSAGGAALLGLTATMHAAFAFGDNTAVIIGPSGVPIPSSDYVTEVDALYIDPAQPFPGQPTYPGVSPLPLFTPEGLYPVTGVKSLPYDASEAQGVVILNDEINQLCPDPPACGGDATVVFGYSQSAVISSIEMDGLAALPPDARPGTDELAFVLVGNESNPNGGLLERFVGLSLPSLGLTFTGATPDDVYPTTIYTLEYDGFADFPRYPIDLLADLNAVAGIVFVHTQYAKLSPEQLAAAIPLQSTAGPTMHYFIIPEDNLPLLDPLRAVPFVGQPLADLIQPDLKVIVNLGYGPDDLGYSNTPANLPTPFGLFPTGVNPDTVLSDLANGIPQGVGAFLHDIGTEQLPSLPSLAGLAGALSSLSSPSSPADLLPSLTDVVNTLTNVAAASYATLLPTADIATAIATTLPLYDTTLFVENLPNLVDAVGYPIAADAGLLSLAGGIEFLVLAGAAQSVVSDLAGLVP